MSLILPNNIDSELLGAYENRDYQQIGTEFLKNVRRGFLTDDPGLGKTIQAINATELPAMVVAPKYLLGQWEDAISRAHEDAVIAHADGTRTQRDKILSKRADWYVLNIEMVHSYDMPIGIRTFLNDEAHHLRHRTSTYSRAVNAMETADLTSRVYNLTATPFWRTIDDIWHQSNILYPQVFTSYHRFVKLYCTSLTGPYGPKVVGVKRHMRGALKELFQHIMLGRTYADVGRYLPETVESTIKIKLPKLQQAIYDKLRRDYSLKWEDENEKRRLIFQPTTVLHALRQVTAHSGKFEAIEGILEDNKDKPAVIGFWYKDHARMMHARIKDNAVLITGDIPGEERQRLARWAQAKKKHIVASEKSLSEGVDLSKYRLFIFGEEDHVPGSNHQFLSRVVRDRNDNGLDKEPVRVFYVHARSTIDEVVHQVSKSRKAANTATRELLEGTLKIKRK